MENISLDDIRLRFHKGGTQKSGFLLCDDDLSSTVRYLGFMNQQGAWIIIKWDSSVDSYRYASGRSGYDFSIRALLNYDYPNKAF